MLKAKDSKLRAKLQHEIEHRSALTCIECGRHLESSADNELVCPASGRRYPIFEGIPILTENPDFLIRGFGESWAGTVVLAEKQTAELCWLKAAGVRSGWLERATRQAQGRSANIALLQRYLAPLTVYLDAHPAGFSASVGLLHAHGAGWSMEAMLPYFAQDWSDSPDFERVQALLIADLVQYAPDRNCVAVLGAGACGIARAAADLFDETYGVDLSLPTLALARGLLAGDDVAVHLQQLGWARVTLRPPAPARKPIFLVAGDVNRLPFANGAVSAVITQYLLDLMNDPLATAREIRRVLKPGGIWVNFSNPLTLQEEESRFGPPAIDEMAPLFAPLGFETLQCERERFTLLNFDHLGARGGAAHQEVHHFVMKQRPRGSCRPEQGRNLPCAADDLWWEQIARRVPHRIVETARKTVFDVAGNGMRFEIGVSGDFVASDASSIQFFEFLMEQIDGRKRLCEIYDRVNACASLPRDEFKAMLLAMERRFGVVSFDAGRSTACV